MKQLIISNLYYTSGKPFSILLMWRACPFGVSFGSSVPMARFAREVTAVNGYATSQPWNEGLYPVNGDAAKWMYNAQLPFSSFSVARLEYGVVRNVRNKSLSLPIMSPNILLCTSRAVL